MTKLKTLLPLILLTALVTLPVYAQIADESQKKPSNDYEIEPEESYSGSMVLEILTELMTAAETEIESAVNEAYSKGYKQGLLMAKPEAEYWKTLYTAVKADTESQIKKLKRERWLFALGGFGAGFIGGGITGISIRLQL